MNEEFDKIVNRIGVDISGDDGIKSLNFNEAKILFTGIRQLEIQAASAQLMETRMEFQKQRANEFRAIIEVSMLPQNKILETTTEAIGQVSITKTIIRDKDEEK